MRKPNNLTSLVLGTALSVATPQNLYAQDPYFPPTTTPLSPITPVHPLNPLNPVYQDSEDPRENSHSELTKETNYRIARGLIISLPILALIAFGTYLHSRSKERNFQD